MSKSSRGPDSRTSSPHAQQQNPPPSGTYFSYPVTHIANSLYRRFTDSSNTSSRSRTPSSSSTVSALAGTASSRLQSRTTKNTSDGTYHDGTNGGTASPQPRRASPFQPPPLTPLTLQSSPLSDAGDGESGAGLGTTRSPPNSPLPPSSNILTQAIAEEIRLLVPPRLQLAETWKLVYSLENDGVSLGTLYSKCSDPHTSSPGLQLGRGCGFILVVQDSLGGIFGAYLTDPPTPASSFYGTGECFLWKASILLQKQVLPLPPSSTSASAQHPLAKSTTAMEDLLLADLPPPPSADPSSQFNVGRSTTLHPHHTSSFNATSTQKQPAASGSASGTSSPSIRFKAFPYSGINDYLIFCESGFLSVGGGDGKYGLWLDSSLEKGVSSAGCLTFGNEALSEEGERFEIVGVEIWGLG